MSGVVARIIIGGFIALVLYLIYEFLTMKEK
jgi:hypothetical protein